MVGGDVPARIDSAMIAGMNVDQPNEAYTIHPRFAFKQDLGDGYVDGTHGPALMGNDTYLIIIRKGPHKGRLCIAIAPLKMLPSTWGKRVRNHFVQKWERF